MTRGVFVTGTDTGVGKTLAACALIHALVDRSVDVAPMKPVAAGAVVHDGGWANEDTIALLRAAGREGPRGADANPFLLREPMAPHIAAAREGREITLGPILQAFERLRESSDFVVVEGVGGFRVPLSDTLDSVDMAKAFALPVVLVVGMRLGCLNHALLTADAIHAARLPFAGWIANSIDPAMSVADENVDALRARLQAPLLGRLPFMAHPIAPALARKLDVSTLLGEGAA
ncbi:MAG TPA: dethiobiotin synthase [Usitatibacter sp.]|nr:dethiobiotin synthase [Usitatibacter sp.]